jgi:very-short-patch-repair endonuclease
VVAARSRPGSESGLESIVRQRLLAIGIEVNQQVYIEGVGRVDMVVRDSRVVIEIDGRTFHSATEPFENDRRRGAELAARKYARIQLTYSNIFGNWPWCVEMVCRALL